VKTEPGGPTASTGGLTASSTAAEAGGGTGAETGRGGSGLLAYGEGMTTLAGMGSSRDPSQPVGAGTEGGGGAAPPAGPSAGSTGAEAGSGGSGLLAYGEGMTTLAGIGSSRDASQPVGAGTEAAGGGSGGGEAAPGDVGRMGRNWRMGVFDPARGAGGTGAAEPGEGSGVSTLDTAPIPAPPGTAVAGGATGTTPGAEATVPTKPCSVCDAPRPIGALTCPHCGMPGTEAEALQSEYLRGLAAIGLEKGNTAVSRN
jgi:hypothetical protein